MRTIAREELQQAIADGSVVVLEALPQAYFDAEHLPGAKNLPLDELDVLAPDLIPDLTTPVVTYCTGLSCPNSGRAAARLRELGYTNVRAYEAGKEDWRGAGLPVEHGVVPAP
jgi:rhodanese-related sulfurtransferase